MTPSAEPTPALESERVLILDFGSQYGQLIARRVREQNVFCQIVRHDLPADRVAELKPKGLILSGGPASVYAPAAPTCDPKISELGIPVLVLCAATHRSAAASCATSSMKCAAATACGRWVPS